MKLKMKKRSIITVCLAVICATFLGVTVSLLSGAVAKAQIANNQTANTAVNVVVPELVLADYDTRTDGAVFSGTALTKLYDALMGATNTANAGMNTYTKVKNSVLGSDVSYGLATSAASGVVPTIPARKTAYDLYNLNGSKNILVDFGGQTWTVTYLTTDTNGDLVVTLWLSDAYKENNAYVRSQWGWYDTTSASNGTAGANAYVSNMYSSSLIRVKTLNGGDPNGGATMYAWGTSGTATTATLSQTVSASDRLASPWAKFTLNNSALAGSAKANQSLTAYLDTPSQIKYTYYEDFNYHYNNLGGNGANYYILNEAISKDLTGAITGSVGANTIRTSTGSTMWYSTQISGVAYTNYSNTAYGYDSWAYDYLWLPSWSETGSTTYQTYYGMPGIWETSKSTKTVANQTGQNLTMSGNGTPVAWNGNQTTINNSEYVWLRSGLTSNTSFAYYLASGGAWNDALTARTLAVRPALHLNLKSAAQAAVTSASATDGYEVPTPNSITEDFNGSAQWMNEFAQIMSAANPNEAKYNWIDTTLHADTNIVKFEKIMYTAKDSAGSAVTTAQDLTTLGSGAFNSAGVYTVTLELAPGYKWYNQPLVANDATSRQYTFTVTISQLKLYYDLKFYDQTATNQPTNSCEYAGATNPVSVRFAPTTSGLTGNYPSQSSVQIYYKGTNNNFGATDNGGKGSLTGPTDFGAYSATLEDNTSPSDYVLTSNSGSATLPFNITRKQVTLPTISASSLIYNGSSQSANFSSSYNANFVQVSAITATGIEGGHSTSYSLTYDAASGTWYNQTGSGGRYEVIVDDSVSPARIYATDAGNYTVEFTLKDTVNTEWASGTPSDKSATLTMARAELTISFSPPGSNYFNWSVGDAGNLGLASLGNAVVSGENVTVMLYWYKDGDPTNDYTMYSTGVPDNTLYSISNFDNTGAGTYWLCAKLDDDTNGDNVNRNYYINSSDPNTGDSEIFAQPMTVTAGSASLDKTVFQFTYSATVPAQRVTGNTMVYEKDSSGNVRSYTVTATGFPTGLIDTYSNNVKSNADTYTSILTLEVPASMQANMEMPDPAAGYSYLGEGISYTRINQYKCQIEFQWTIEQKEIDLSSFPFEYSTDATSGTDTSATWQTYNPANPPEAEGFTLIWVRIPATTLANTGALSATATNYQNQYGPGTIHFDFSFTLDSNYKAQAGQTQTAVPYSMDTTGTQIAISWVRVQLTDSNGNPVVDSLGVPYFVYELDMTNVPSSVQSDIKYEYYDDAGNTYGSIISGLDVGVHKGLGYVIDPTNSNCATSQNPVTVYVRPVIDNMQQVNGVDPYVLVASASNPEYLKITVGDNRRAVDLQPTQLTSMTYGGTVNISDAYTIKDTTVNRDMPAGSYKVSLQDATGAEVTPDVTNFDFSTLDAGNYKLVFAMVGIYDTTHVLMTNNVPFTVEAIKLTAPTLKAGVTLTFNGTTQYLKDSLDNWNDTYMEFAGNSVDDAYHAGPYTAVINIKSQYAGNYVFELPATPSGSPTRAQVRAVTTDAAVSVPQLSNGNTTEALPWSIEKYVIDTTQSSAWDFTANGAALSYKGMPASVKALITGANPTLNIQILYYDLDGNYLFNDVGEGLKGGDKYLVAAYLDPNSTDYDDVEFKNQDIDPMTSQMTSPQMAYTVPQSGAAALMGKIADFMTGTLLGLPVWAWFLIGLALLILLIIIIVVAAKRRKTKEQREEIKAKKEEEKQRKEEERQRREEERQAQKERLEAERELAKAKQEAELEKIRAQAGMGMAGAGMATMAMQQQPQQAQQPVQQPVQQPQPQYQQPQPQTVQDSSILAELRAQMAEMRAENRATQAQMQAMQNMPHYAPQYPQYAPAPAPAAAPASADSNLMTLMEMKLQMSEMKNAQAVAELKTAQALAEAKSANQHNNGNSQQAQQPIIVMAPSSPYSPNYPNYGGYPSVNMGYGMQALPAPQQMMPTYGMVPPYGFPPYGMVPPYGYAPVAMLPQPSYAPAKAKEEEEPVVTATSQTTPSMTMSQQPYCPPGAVMTTTTTIDTSRGENNSTVKRTSADNVEDVNFDIDGFYDPFN